MASVTMVIRGTLTRFVPMLAVVMVMLLVVVERSLAGINWGVFGLEVAAIAVGFTAALAPLTSKLDPRVLGSPWRYLASATLAVVALGTLSAFTRGVGVEAITLFSLAAGMLAAFPMMWGRGRSTESAE